MNEQITKLIAGFLSNYLEREDENGIPNLLEITYNNIHICFSIRTGNFNNSLVVKRIIYIEELLKTKELLHFGNLIRHELELKLGLYSKEIP